MSPERAPLGGKQILKDPSQCFDPFEELNKQRTSRSFQRHDAIFKAAQDAAGFSRSQKNKHQLRLIVPDPSLYFSPMKECASKGNHKLCGFSYFLTQSTLLF